MWPTLEAQPIWWQRLCGCCEPQQQQKAEKEHLISGAIYICWGLMSLDMPALFNNNTSKCAFSPFNCTIIASRNSLGELRRIRLGGTLPVCPSCIWWRWRTKGGEPNHFIQQHWYLLLISSPYLVCPSGGVFNGIFNLCINSKQTLWVFFNFNSLSLFYIFHSAALQNKPIFQGLYPFASRCS